MCLSDSSRLSCLNHSDRQEDHSVLSVYPASAIAVCSSGCAALGTATHLATPHNRTVHTHCVMHRHTHAALLMHMRCAGHSLPGILGGSVVEALAGTLLVAGVCTEAVKYIEGTGEI